MSVPVWPISYDRRGRTECEFHRIPGVGLCKAKPEFLLNYRRSDHPSEYVTEKTLCRVHTREMFEVIMSLMEGQSDGNPESHR